MKKRTKLLLFGLLVFLFVLFSFSFAFANTDYINVNAIEDSTSNNTNFYFNNRLTGFSNKLNGIILNHEHTEDSIIFDKSLNTALAGGFTVSSGNYYLTSDLTVIDGIYINEDNVVRICLNGYVLKMQNCVVSNEGTLYLYDCKNDDDHIHYFNKNATNGYWELTSNVTTNIVKGGIFTSTNTSNSAIINYKKLYINNVNFVGNTCINDTSSSPSCISGFSGSDELYVKNSKFIGNYSTTAAGAISAYNFAEIDKCEFAENGSNAGPGAVYIDNNANIYNSTFKYNKTKSGDGGAIYTKSSSGKTLVENCTFNNNSASCGGAIYVNRAIVTLINTTIENNSATKKGGGIYSAEPFTCLAKGTKITMADGSYKNIEDVKVGEMVKTLDHMTGELSSQKVSYKTKGLTKESSFTLHFTNGVELTLVGAHTLFEKESLKYVLLNDSNVNNYIGSYFYNADAARYEKLLSVTFDGEVEYYSIDTAYHLNSIANGMLNATEDGYLPLIAFDINEDLAYDKDKMQADIEKYGLFKFRDAPFFSKQDFDQNLTERVNIIVGKGYRTLSELFNDAMNAIQINDPDKMAFKTNTLKGVVKNTYETYISNANTSDIILVKDVVIKNNTVESVANNLQLFKDSARVIDGATGIDVGITLDNKTGYFSKKVYSNQIGFTSDNPQYLVLKVENDSDPVTYDYKIDSKVLYNGNCDDFTGDLPTDTNPYEVNDVVTASTDTLSRDGYLFKGWALTEDAIDPITSTKFLGEQITLYAVWKVGPFSVDKDSDSKDDIVVSTENDFPANISVEVEVTLESEVKTSIDSEEITDFYALTQDNAKLADNEAIGIVFDVKLFRTISGVKTQIQPSDIKAGTVITVKMLIPSTIDLSKVTRILHVHSLTDIESYSFDPSKVVGGYYTINVTKLSEFAFVYDTSSELDNKKLDYLNSILETIIQLNGDGYDLKYDETSDDLGIKSLVDAANVNAAKLCYKNCLDKINAFVKGIETYRATKITELETYADDKDVVINAEFVSLLEGVNTKAKLDKALLTLKKQIDDVKASKTALDTSLSNLSTAVTALGTDAAANLTTVQNAITTANNSLLAVLNDSTNGLAAINVNVEVTKTTILSALTALQNSMVSEFSTQTADIQLMVDTLEATLGTSFDDVKTKIDDVNNDISNFIISSTDTLTAAIDDVNINIALAQTGILSAISSLQSDVASLLTSQTADIQLMVDALEATLGTKFTSVETKIDAAKTDISALIDTKTTVVTDAIALTNAKIDNAETSILSAITTLQSDVASLLANQTADIQLMVDTLEATLGTNLDEVKTKIDEAKTDISALVDTKTTVITDAIALTNAKIDNAETSILSAIITLQTNVSDLFVTQTADLKAYIDTLETKLNTKFTEVKTKLDEVDKDINAMSLASTADMMKAIKALSTKVDNVENNILDTIKSLKTDLVNTLTTKTDVLKAYIDTLEENLGTKFDNVETKISDAVTSINDFTTLEINDTNEAISALSDKVDTVNDDILEAIDLLETNLTAALKAKTQEVIHYMDLVEEDMLDNFDETNKLINDALTSITDLVDTETSDIDSAIDTLKDNVSKAEENIIKAINTLKTDLTKSLSEKVDSIIKTITDLSLDSKYTNLEKEINDAKEALVELNNTNTKSLDQAISALSTKVDNVETNINKSINSLKVEVINTIDEKTKNVLSGLDTLYSKLGINFDEVTKLINSSYQNLVTVVNNDNQELKTLLSSLSYNVTLVEKNIESSVNAVYANLEKLLNDKTNTLLSSIEQIDVNVNNNNKEVLAYIADLEYTVNVVEEYVDNSLVGADSTLEQTLTESKSISSYYEKFFDKIEASQEVQENNLNKKYNTNLTIVIILLFVFVSLTVFFYIKSLMLFKRK